MEKERLDRIKEARQLIVDKLGGGKLQFNLLIPEDSLYRISEDLTRFDICKVLYVENQNEAFIKVHYKNLTLPTESERSTILWGESSIDRGQYTDDFFYLTTPDKYKFKDFINTQISDKFKSCQDPYEQLKILDSFDSAFDKIDRLWDRIERWLEYNEISNTNN